MAAGDVTECCRAVTCPRVLQHLVFSLELWGAVGSRAMHSFRARDLISGLQKS